MSQVNNYLQRKYGHNLAADVQRRIQAKVITLTGNVGWDIISQGSIIDTQQFSAHTNAQLALLYTKNGLVYACVREKATSIAEAPLQVGTTNEDGDFEPDEKHELLSLFYANPNYSYTELMELLVARLELTGANFFLLSPFQNRDGTGQITPLPTNIVEVKTDGPEILGYKITTDKTPRPIVPDEMCSHMYLDPNKLHSFISPLAAAVNEVQIDEERQRMTKEIMVNKQIPGLILKATGVVNEPQRKLITESLDASIGREGGNRARPLFLPKGIDVSEVTGGGHDIDFSALNALTETRICMVYQVPPIIIGSKAGMDRSTFSNYAEARKSFYFETINPLWAFIASGLTRCIIDTATGLEFRFDTSGVKELQKDLVAITKTAEEAYTAGLITRNEGRSLMDIGLERLEDEEEGGFKQPAPAPVPAPAPAREGDDDDDEDTDDEDGQKKTYSLELRPEQPLGLFQNQGS